MCSPSPIVCKICNSKKLELQWIKPIVSFHSNFPPMKDDVGVTIGVFGLQLRGSWDENILIFWGGFFFSSLTPCNFFRAEDRIISFDLEQCFWRTYVFKLFILSWSIADRQCCDSFRWTAKGIQPHICTHLFSPTLPSTPGCHVHWAEFPVP